MPQEQKPDIAFLVDALKEHVGDWGTDVLFTVDGEEVEYQQISALGCRDAVAVVLTRKDSQPTETVTLEYHDRIVAEANKQIHELEGEIARIHKILDQHLPTIMFALGEEVYSSSSTYKDRDELTEREVSMRAAYSAVHAIPKDITTDNSAQPLYDLPSVVDLMKTRKTSDNRAEVRALMDAAEDAVFSGVSGIHNVDSPAAREQAVKDWLEARATRISREI